MLEAHRAVAELVLRDRYAGTRKRSEARELVVEKLERADAVDEVVEQCEVDPLAHAGDGVETVDARDEILARYHTHCADHAVEDLLMTHLVREELDDPHS